MPSLVENYCKLEVRHFPPLKIQATQIYQRVPPYGFYCPRRAISETHQPAAIMNNNVINLL
ncbi:Uncharacterised protein [Serratia rubidaea]|nr:Uncharacterised protein [Serratia rubidaea]